MIEYYLKFTDEATANAVLNTSVDEVLHEDGYVIVESSVTPNYANISVIGVISKPTGTLDSEGSPVMVALEGWHVNVKTPEALELVQYQIFPVAPMRVWAS